MSAHDWDFIMWQRASDLLQQAERIRRNFLQVAEGARYRTSHGRTPSWEPPVNVVETDESLWVISAVPGVAVDRVDVRLVGRFERRLRLVGGEKPLSIGEISFHDGLFIIEIRKHS